MLFLISLFFPFYILTGSAQGTTYTIKYVADKELIRKYEVDSLLSIIDQSLSLYKPLSKINEFNAHGRVTMDVHMKTVIQASLDCYRDSNGSFDITSASISSIWGFGINEKHSIPSKKKIRKALTLTGSQYLIISGDTLLTSKKGVKIDCNGIAQGYTVDVISSFLESRGLKQFMVELGGEIVVKGEHPDSGLWKIGIESSGALASNFYPVEDYIALRDKAITTSGVNRKRFQYNGKNYSHIIDPKTGKPIDAEILTVTVIANNALTADAWDNAFLVMGIEKLKKLLMVKKDILVHVAYLDKNGEVKIFSNLKK